MEKKDLIIIGTGVSGMFCAINRVMSDSNQQILLVCKSQVGETNTRYAQGGIAIVSEHTRDASEHHISDTMKSGSYLNNFKVVKSVVDESQLLLHELEQIGLQFDRRENGEYDLHLEGGHKYKRILHFKDSTGQHLQDCLIKKVREFSNIEIREFTAVIDLIVENGRCFGISTLNAETGEIYEILSRHTVLATGGLGQIFRHTTNTVFSTGDGIGIAIRANAKIENIEFIQFHPTALFTGASDENQLKLISEAVRGEGAVLRNVFGDKFLYNYDSSTELSSRDKVARAIIAEMKRTESNFVYLDCTGINGKQFKNKFPVIYNWCRELNLDPGSDYIPVVPAAHYSCGGIKTNDWGETNIKNLFACGECASTGMHGANRLASNSLLESMIFARRCSDWIENDSLKDKSYGSFCLSHKFPTKFKGNAVLNEEIQSLRIKIQELMSQHFAIISNDKELIEAKMKFNELKNEMDSLLIKSELTVPLIELRNIFECCNIILTKAIYRKDNVGCFFKLQ